MLIAACCQNPLESSPLRRPFPGQRQALPQQVLKPVPPRDLPPMLFQHIFQRSVIPSPPLDCFPAPSHLLHPPSRFLELESSYGGGLVGGTLSPREKSILSQLELKSWKHHVPIQQLSKNQGRIWH